MIFLTLEAKHSKQNLIFLYLINIGTDIETTGLITQQNPKVSIRRVKLRRGPLVNKQVKYEL